MNNGKKIQIVVVDGATAVTGALRCASRIARAVGGHAETTLVLPLESQIEAAELSHFKQVRKVRIVRVRKSPASLALYGPALLQSGWALKRVLDQTGSTALVLNDFSLMQGVVAKLLGYRGRIVTWVRFDPDQYPGILSRMWLGAGLRASNRMVAVSEFIKNKLPASEKVRRIYDSIDPKLTQSPAWPPRERGRDIVCVGNYIRGKGQDWVIEAFALIAKDFPDIRLIFHGGDMGLEKNRAYRNLLERRAASSAAAGQIIFNGFARDLSAAFSGAAMAVNLSESESFSLSCLEASQFGLPVIAFRSGGPEEIIVDGETGYLAELGDITAVAQAMALLLREPARAAAMGVAGAAFVQQRFSPLLFEEQVVEALTRPTDHKLREPRPSGGGSAS